MVLPRGAEYDAIGAVSDGAAVDQCLAPGKQDAVGVRSVVVIVAINGEPLEVELPTGPHHGQGRARIADAGQIAGQRRGAGDDVPTRNLGGECRGAHHEAAGESSQDAN